MTKDVELIIIGTELSRGIIADQHCQLVSRELTHLGYHMRKMVIIPDDGTIVPVLREAVAESDVVIVTGGLGPTSDDMTRSAIAQVSGVPLVRNERCFETLYKRIGERIWGANEKQVMLPESFDILPNPNGTAEGFYGRSDEVLIIALPGPPREMRPMFYDYVLPLLAKEIGHDGIEREEYSTFLMAEAKLEELTEEADSELDWGTRFQDYRISLYVSKGDSEKRKRAIARLRELCGSELVASGDVTALDSLSTYLLERKLTIGTAESCTGGLCSMLLTSRPGSSAYFMGGVASYDNSVKERVLGVRKSTLEEKGAVSLETAREMAEGALELLSTDCALSITGVAGPACSDEKPVGLVCFGLAAKNRETECVRLRFTSSSRELIRRRSAVAAFILMKEFLEGKDLVDMVTHWTYI